MSATKNPVDTTTVVHTFIKGQDGKTYVISPGVLEAFSLEGSLLITIDGKSYAIPKAVVELQPLAEDASADINEALDKQELPKQPQGMMSVWGLAAYSACFYAAWAGGGSAVAAGDYCEAKYL